MKNQKNDRKTQFQKKTWEEEKKKTPICPSEHHGQEQESVSKEMSTEQSTDEKHEKKRLGKQKKSMAR